MKKNKISKIIGVAAGLSGIAAITSCGSKQDFTIVKDYLIEMPTYKSVDYDYAQQWFRENPIRDVGGCSAVAKDVGTDTEHRVLVGRNMDYSFSKKCAYIIRTDEPGLHKTLGFAYATNKASPDFAYVKEHGISEEWRKIAPFFCTDIINDKGLYCEIDMRNIEYDASTGENKFWCEGTNPGLGHPDVHMVALTRFVVGHCDNVTDAVTYVKNNINVFNKVDEWNFSFLLADATGHYGVLEFDHNTVHWNDGADGVNCQTNYFISPEMETRSENKFGIGRWNYLREKIPYVTDTKSMFNLINQLSYSNVYKGWCCPFDMRSEASDFMPEDIPYEWLLPSDQNPDHLKRVYEVIDAKLKELEELPETERRKLSWYWQSTFTNVVDIFNRTIHIRMFEDPNYVFDFKL
ncbi:MAG: carcinine hydrolase/isopenicillin-N N-acyltransferase family protein [Mycoplasmoidaceae bacterium]